MSYVSRTPLVEAWHPGGFLVSQPRGHRHIDRGTFSGAIKVLPGTVMGKQTVGTTAAAVPLSTNVGNGTIGAISVGAATAGEYGVEFVDATHFVVSDPTGKRVGHGTAGAAFKTGALGFTVKAGATAFSPGDGFIVTVAAGSGKWVPCTKVATDGSQIAAGISFGLVDATLADVPGALVVRDCEVNASELVWAPSMDSSARTTALAQLLALKIIPR